MQNARHVARTIVYDVCIANGENATEGKGIIARDADELFNAGVHVITSGNHVWDNWAGRRMLGENERVLRPHNYPRNNPGKGVYVLKLLNGVKVGVVNVQGRVYMQAIDCPFRCMDGILYDMQHETPIILVDMHADATAEKMAMGWYLDGKVSAVVGTHTHTPTADARVLPGGTAYITDVGMERTVRRLGARLETGNRHQSVLTQTPHKYEVSPTVGTALRRAHHGDVKSGKALAIESIILPGF